MNIILSNNVFTRVLSSCFPEETKLKVKYLPSAQITQSIESDDSLVGLIPVMDLLKHKDLNVSGKFGISFEGSLCNSYLYFSKEDKSISKISLAGDVSSQEVILSKILFKEMYGSEVEIEILTNINKAANKDFILVGDENFVEQRFLKGISFSELMIDTFSLPYVNYVFVSKNKENLESFVKNLDGIESLIYEKFEKVQEVSPFGEDLEGADISSFAFKFDEQDREGINQILRLPYFHGMVKDIIEVKFNPI